ncbi:MAG: PPOX class F420-dependent oxidoreductase [Candidatus Nitrosotenuis sp.]
MSSDKITLLQGHKYINLETYKRNGTPVQTPVWFVIDNEQIFVMTTENTGKVKRIKNNPNVRIMPCGMRGEPKGDWIQAVARFADNSEAEKAATLRNKKYGFRAKLVGMFIKKDKPVVLAIQV